MNDASSSTFLLLNENSFGTDIDDTLEDSTDSRYSIDQRQMTDGSTITANNPNEIENPQKHYDVEISMDKGTTTIQDKGSNSTGPLLNQISMSTNTDDDPEDSTDTRESIDQIEIPNDVKSKVGEKISNAKNATELVHDLLCTQDQNEKLIEWNKLCSENFVRKATQILLNGDDLDVVQIGAHTGFEENDPIAAGLATLLDEVSAISSSDAKIVRNKFHWTFVEASPPNFKRLEQNLQKHSICDMKAINAGVVPDGFDGENSTNMTFYTIRDTIDPETGYDSLSGRKLPGWITQVSSFSKKPILFNRGVFKRHGLNVHDYIVATNVRTLSYSGVIKEALKVEKKDDKVKPPFLVLIDTEGFDCDIVKGISPSSQFLPEYLLFELKSCKKGPALNHLKNDMGYIVHETDENCVARRKLS